MTEPTDPAPRTVLLVEDDDDIRDAVQDALERRGYQVLTAEDGQKALALLRALPVLPGVILLDLTMPVMNGWEFMSAQAADPALAAIPVVVLSAVPNLAQESKTHHWSGVLSKPISLVVLLETIGRFFSRTSP
jgi:CheY-like chemotaxis protein